MQLLKWLKRHQVHVWSAVVLGHLALLLAVYHRVWWAEPRQRLFFGWDCLRAYWQDLVFVTNALEAGELPLWNPYMLLGYPFHSEPQTGLFSPMNWVLYGAGYLSGNKGPWLIQAKVLLTLWVGMLGMHVWLFRRHGSHVIAWFGATIFVIGSPLLVFKNSALVWPVLYLPWCLLALERFVAKPTYRRGALLAGSLWLCGGAGSPQGFFFCLLALGSYYLWLTLTPLRQSWPRLRQQLPALMLTLVLVFLLLAPVYLSAALAMPFTPRANRSLAFLLAQPLEIKGLEELLLAFRDRNWMLDVYMGSITLVLAAYALVSATRRTWAFRLFWLTLTGIGILLSLGEHTPLLPWLIKNIPGFDLFRIPYRYKLLFAVGLTVLACEGFSSLVQKKVLLWQRIAWVALVGLWLAYLISASIPNSSTRTVLAVATARQTLYLSLAAVALITIWSLVRSRLGVALGILAVALIIADLWQTSVEKIKIMERPPRPQRDYRLYANLGGLRGRGHRIFQNPTHFTAPNAKVREFSGYGSFPMRLKRYDALSRRARHNPALLAHFNVRWLQTRRVRGRRGGLRRHGHGLYENTQAVGLLEVYPGFKIQSDKRALASLSRPPPLRCAALEPSQLKRLPKAARALKDRCRPHRDSDSPMPKAKVGLIYYGLNRIDLWVYTPEAGVAVLNEPYYPGWHARVDGKPTALFQANYMLRGVYLPRGFHHVSFHYRPTVFYFLIAGFIIGFMVMILLLGFRRGPPKFLMNLFRTWFPPRSRQGDKSPNKDEASLIKNRVDGDGT